MPNFICSYVHGGKIGVLVEFTSEKSTVFEAPDFQEVAHGISMHVAGCTPSVVSEEELANKIFENDLKSAEKHLAELSDAEKQKQIEQIHFRIIITHCLLSQPYIKDPDLTVFDVLKNLSLNLGENVVVARFVRWDASET